MHAQPMHKQQNWLAEVKPTITALDAGPYLELSLVPSNEGKSVNVRVLGLVTVQFVGYSMMRVVLILPPGHAESL